MSDAAPSDDAANWSLLPHRPIEFFGLAKGFDRADLKRAYNKLLRIYKPDKFPEEFQRLRAAYEHLDTAVRYDSPEVAVDPQLQSQWIAQADSFSTPIDSSEPIVSPSSSAPQVPPLQQLLVCLDEQSPENLYHELKSKTPESPLDYYARAVLSDSVHTTNEIVFLQWILAGLEKHRDEPSLLRLLVEYLQTGQIPDASLAEVLVGVSKVMATDRFFFFTERLLDRLTQVVPWSEFERVLGACRHNINDHQVRGQVVFSCHLLRRAIWLAPPESTQKLADFIEEHIQYLGAGFEYDYEFNIRLIAYVSHRKTFTERGPLCKRIDEALRAYCLDPGEVSNLKIVACQTRLAQQPESLFAEFPYPAEDNDALITPWIWACDEVLECLEKEAEPTSVGHRHAATLKLLQQIDATFPVSSLQFYNLLRVAFALIGYVAALFLPIFPIVLVMELLPLSFVQYAWIAVGIFPVISVVLFHFLLKPKTIDVWMGKYLFHIVCRHYGDWWRNTIARFHAATHLRYSDVRQASMDLVQHRHTELNVSTWFSQLYSADVAMVLYATAVRFLR